MADHAIYEQLRRIRYDLTAAQGKITAAFAMLDQLNLPETKPNVCPVDGCGYRPSINMPSLAEHAHQAHGASAPEDWDARAHHPAQIGGAP